MKKTLVLILLVCLLANRPMQAPIIEGVVYLQDFASLQDAINLVPNGGTIMVPRGIWEGDMTIPAGKYVSIQGVSPAVIGQSPPLNSYQWDYLLTNYPDTFLNGSILRGHLTATGNSSKISMTDILMIGHGSGVGIELGSSSAMGYGSVLDNVSIGNYEIGVRATKLYNLSINKMQLHGVGTALIIRDGNLNRLWDVDVMNCTLGADLKGEIIWHGGSVQHCSDGVRVYQTAGYVGGLHFEAITGTALYFDGWGGKLDPNYYATNSGTLVINGYNNLLEIGWVNGIAQFTAATRYNKVRMYGNYNDEGYGNLINK